VHVESHRPEELCTAVQKLALCLHTLKLHLVIVTHLICRRGIGDGGIDGGARNCAVHLDGFNAPGRGKAPRGELYPSI